MNFEARRWEWLMGLLATLMAVALHAVFLFHAGPLWRDEASTVWVATLPSFRDLWASLPHDHCPLLIHLLIRGWSALGLASTDLALRALGMLIGLLLPATYWIASRLMGNRPPLLPLALIGLNAVAIRVTDSFRGYGLGCAFSVLTLAFVWRLSRKTSFVSILAALLAAVLSVQCLYQNAFFVLAACAAGLVVCALGRRWTNALCILLVGAAAAASLTPYLPLLRQARDWYILEKAGLHFLPAWQSASSVTGFPLPGFEWVWIVLCLYAAWTAFPKARQPNPEAACAGSRDLVVFAAVALVIGIAGFVVFLKIADLPARAWYFVPLLAFVAACLDAILAFSHRCARTALLLFAALAIALAAPRGLNTLRLRQTNIDLIASRLTRDASPKDLIIVNPWYYAASFARYYKGPTPWTTLPQLDDHRLHRYDLLKIKMQLSNPIQPVLDELAATLQSGNRVWLIGYIPISNKPPPQALPAPNSAWGWDDELYARNWGALTGYFIALNADQAQLILDAAKDCNPLEDLQLLLITGWHGAG